MGLPYASKVKQVDLDDGMTKPVMHGCGHDMHIVCLLGAAELRPRLARIGLALSSVSSSRTRSGCSAPVP